MSGLSEKMRDFIRERQSGKPLDWLIGEVMTDLAEICRVAETGEYPLLYEEEIDRNQVLTAIRKAAGLTAERLSLQSCAGIMSRSEWNEIFSSVRDDLGRDLADVYVRNGPLDNKVLSEIRDTIGESLSVPFGTAMVKRLGLPQKIGLDEEGQWFLRAILQRFGMIQGAVLLIFIAAAILRDTDILEKIYPLLQLMPKLIIIGELKNEPGTWLAICA